MPGPVLVIGGPTAAGKSAAALEVACRWRAALVSADAMQVYRGFDVGTAKPPRSVLGRYPHACVDVRDWVDEFSVADFLSELERVRGENERVVVVGGTPFWLSALIRPLAPLPPGDPEVRARLESLEDPHAALAAVDPPTAARLHPRDRVRIVRALEVHALTGRPISEIHRNAARPRVPCVIAWLDRDDLDARIAARLERMVEHGYTDEVRDLLDRGVSRECKPMRSFGYRHMAAWAAGELPLEEALRLTGRDTRKLARKQRTWARGLGWRATDRAGVREAARRAFGASVG